MRKFDPYPIYVNFADRWEATRLRQGAKFAMRNDRMMVNWLNSTGKDLYEITEDKAPSVEARAFEHRVFNLLRLIASTRMGKLLFDSLNPANKYWILPNTYPNAKPCKCGASEFPAGPKGGGGFRVYIDPQDWLGSSVKFLSADDVLFHEMVHAYRDGRKVRGPRITMPISEYRNGGGDSIEEFFALQMQNVYLWYRGSHRYYRSYDRRIPMSKDTAYQHIAGNAELLMAFRYLSNDPLAVGVARWMQPANSFNPWRDLPILERLYLNESDIKQLPSFLGPPILIKSKRP
jgi:hypothetical protein